MSSFDKVIKGACKPKAAPPKSKYLDSIIAATWSEDGAVHDVCKALSPRFREPNAIVVFKALIVLHTMIRNGATDNVLGYLSTMDVLKLRNVSGGNWEGYIAPENLQNYATYLDSRIRAFRDLKHDAIRVQSESNRDMRNSNAIEDDTVRRRDANSTSHLDRRKTIMGRKLRVMTVEKGLLRETKVVQKMINALVECRFYLDNLDDQLNITTLRMLVKDLLILFQACNEGVINVLEHYFEMSRVDAGQALSLYRHFCKQTERVVEFLGVAKKLQNLLNVPIPNLKHAPVSLAGALEEYLNDPNFEQNRIEYKTNKENAERRSQPGARPKSLPKTETVPKDSSSTNATPASSSTVTAISVENGKPSPDFFSAIEEDQPTIFNPQAGDPTTTYIPQATFNPFSQNGASAPQPMQMQQTGFMMPQNTAFQVPQQQHSPHNPFGQHQQPYQQMPFLQTHPMQPQMTGVNPFRQNTPMTQASGFSPFGSQQHLNGLPNAFQTQRQSPPPQSANLPAFNFASFGAPIEPFTASPSVLQQSPSSVPPRPASVPLSSFNSSASSSAPSPPAPEPVKSHQTGSRNPFGIPTAPPPAVPKVPTLMELAMGMTQQQQQQQQQQPQQTGPLGLNGFGSASPTQPTNMSSVASDFSFLNHGQKPPTNFTRLESSLSPQLTSTTTVSSSDTLFSPLSSQQTGATTTTRTSSAPSVQVTSPNVQSHVTGVFTGLKPFKPSSSFGAQLLESLPPIPQSAPGTPPANVQNPLPAFGTSASGTLSPAPYDSSSNANGASDGSLANGVGGLGHQSGGLGSRSTALGALNSQPTGALGVTSFGRAGGAFGGGISSVGVGLRPQMTGGVANPFRVSTFGGGPPSSQANGTTSFGSAGTNPPMFGNFTGISSLGGGGGTFGQSQPQQQQSMI